MFILAILWEVTSYGVSPGVPVLHFSIQILALKLAKLDHFVKLIFKPSTLPAHYAAPMTRLHNNG